MCKEYAVLQQIDIAIKMSKRY